MDNLLCFRYKFLQTKMREIMQLFYCLYIVHELSVIFQMWFNRISTVTIQPVPMVYGGNIFSVMLMYFILSFICIIWINWITNKGRGLQNNYLYAIFIEFIGSIILRQLELWRALERGENGPESTHYAVQTQTTCTDAHEREPLTKVCVKKVKREKDRVKRGVCDGTMGPVKPRLIIPPWRNWKKKNVLSRGF